MKDSINRVLFMAQITPSVLLFHKFLRLQHYFERRAKRLDRCHYFYFNLSGYETIFDIDTFHILTKCSYYMSLDDRPFQS